MAPLAARIAFPAGILLLLAGSLALASPMDDSTEGGSVFTGPTEPHATSIYINPASLIHTSAGKHIYLGSNVRFDSIGVDRTAINESGATSSGPGTSTTTWSPGGTLAGYWTVLEGRAVFGASIHTPFSQRFARNQEALKYHVLGGHVAQTLLSTGGGFRVADWLSFGLGFSIGYSRIRFDFARDSALEAGSNTRNGTGSDCGGSPCGLENPEAAEGYRLQASNGGSLGRLFQARNLGLTLGFAIRIRPDWWLATSYVSPPGALPSRSLALELDGTARVEQSPRDGGAVHKGRSEITFQMPQSVWLGLRGPIAPGYDLVTSLRWQNLSRHRQFDIRMFGGDLEDAGVPEWYPRFRGLRDVWQISGGVETQDTGATRWGARLRFETGATTDRTVSPLQISGNNVTAMAGSEIRLNRETTIQAGYGLTWFPKVKSTDSAFDPLSRLACVDSDYDFNRCRPTREGRGIPSAAGEYERLSHTISLSLRRDWL